VIRLDPTARSAILKDLGYAPISRFNHLGPVRALASVHKMQAGEHLTGITNTALLRTSARPEFLRTPARPEFPQLPREPLQNTHSDHVVKCYMDAGGRKHGFLYTGRNYNSHQSNTTITGSRPLHALLTTQAKSSDSYPQSRLNMMRRH
jgi:hypothetical protein